MREMKIYRRRLALIAVLTFTIKSTKIDQTATTRPLIRLKQDKEALTGVSKEKPLKRKQIQLGYKNLNRAAISANGWPFGFGYTTSSLQIAETKIDFKIDFNTKSIFVGSINDAGWGVLCTPSNQCSEQTTAFQATILDTVPISGNQATSLIGLEVSGSDEPRTFPTELDLIKSGDPYSKTASIGLGPGGSFWPFLKSVGGLSGGFNIKFGIKGGTLAENMAPGGTANPLAPSLTLAADVAANPIQSFPVAPVDTPGSPYTSFGFSGATITLPYKNPSWAPSRPAPEGGKVSLVQSQNKICITPDLPGVFAAQLDAKTLSLFEASYNAVVCPGARSASDIPSKCTQARSAPAITITIGNQVIKLAGSDWVYLKKDASTGAQIATKAAFVFSGATPEGVFAAGGPCEGATFALGRNFFTRFELTISADSNLKEFSVGFTDTATAGWVEWAWMLGIGGGIAILVFLILVLCVCYKPKKKSNRSVLEEVEGEVYQKVREMREEGEVEAKLTSEENEG